jgi:4-nitrophenyl phosphatase
VRVDDVFGSAYGAARFIQQEFGGGKAFVIGERGLRAELEAAGIELLPASRSADADFVVVGLDRAFNYAKLDAALRAVMSGAVFIATNEDARLPVENGAKPGAGCMVAALSACAKRRPDVVIGKPNSYLLEMAMEAMGLKRDEVAFIGDGIETDIAMANAAGVYSILVLTGNVRKADLARLPSRLKPSAVLASVGELPLHW